MELKKIENQFPLNLSNDQSGQICIRHDFDELAYTLSNLGQKILYEILAKLNSRDEGDKQAVKLDAAELDRIGIGFSKAHIYKAFPDVCKEVQSLQLTILGTDDKYDYRGTIPLFKASLTKFFKNTNSIAEAYFAISDEASPYLTSLTREMRFNTILAEQIRILKRAHSMRLYQWLRKYHWVTIRREKTDNVEISVDDMMLALDFGRSTKDWREFKRRILDVAVKEVNEKSDIRCEYEIGQRGKSGKIISMLFSIRNSSTFQPSDDLDAKEIESDLEGDYGKDEGNDIKSVAIKMLAIPFPEITDQQVEVLMTKYQAEELIDAIGLVVLTKPDSIKTTKMKYFLGILEKRREKMKSQLDTPARGKTLQEKMTDRSWADGLNFDEPETVE